MFYLSDRENNDPKSARDIRNTRGAVSTKDESGQFQQGGRLESGFGTSSYVDTGYGDSIVKAADSDGNCAAVWVRQTEDITMGTANLDGTLDEGQQMLQMNSTEIISDSPNGDVWWLLTQLTNNSTPDLAPMVATNGERTIVAWREVSSSGVDNLTNFDQ